MATSGTLAGSQGKPILVLTVRAITRWQILCPHSVEDERKVTAGEDVWLACPNY